MNKQEDCPFVLLLIKDRDWDRHSEGKRKRACHSIQLVDLMKQLFTGGIADPRPEWWWFPCTLSGSG